MSSFQFCMCGGARSWQLFQGVEGVGGAVKWVIATQREVRKEKLAIHEALGRGAFFSHWVGGAAGGVSTLEP